MRERRPEMEQALLKRTAAIGASAEHGQDDQRTLRTLVRGAFDYSVEAISTDDAEPPPVPSTLLSHARTAARWAVGLDVLLRRYVAGATLIDDLIFETAEVRDCPQAIRRRHAAFERLLAAISEEYRRERERHCRSREARLFDCVLDLLTGTTNDLGKLDYPLDLEHVALIARGKESAPHLRQLPTTSPPIAARS